jgi:hypothetical protein
MRRLRRAVLDPATLLPHILHFGHRPGTDDPRVAASHWTDAAQLPPDIPPATDLATPHVQIGAELFGGHLEPLFAALHEATGIAPQILWGKASNRIATL